MADLREVTLQEFQHLLAAYCRNPQRKLTSVHLHHTWRPGHRDWRGLATMQAMRRYHMERMGMRDIAQHLTIAPDGGLWLGRAFSWAPGSAKDNNGTSREGPFMIEMVGDFDENQGPGDLPPDRLQGEQLDAVVAVLANIARAAAFTTPEEVTTWLKAHTEFAAKSCPGTGFFDESRKLWREVFNGGNKSLPDLVKEQIEKTGSDAVPQMDEAVLRALGKLQAGQRSTTDLPFDEGSPPENDRDYENTLPTWTNQASLEQRGMAGRGGGDNATKLDRRAHVINSAWGELSSENHSTTTADLDYLFNYRLRKWMKERRQEKRQPRILLWAHGGLVNERSALAQAEKWASFWKDNNIYPIYFVWESGWWDVLRQDLFGGRGIVDFPLERLARVGKGLWSRMKESSWRNSQKRLENGSPGAARLAGDYLRTMLAAEQHPDGAGPPEIHAVGHSAGSIFFTDMIAEGIIGSDAFPLASLQFLAPALTLDRFHDDLVPKIGEGKGISRFAMFTMDDGRERDDHCGRVYGKSLLYLVSRSLEIKRKTPLLGMEQSLIRDEAKRSINALGINTSQREMVSTSPDKPVKVFWSRASFRPPVASLPPPVSTQKPTLPPHFRYTDARRHGDFDDDPATLNHLVRRINGFADTDTQPIAMPAETFQPRSGLRSLHASNELIEELRDDLRASLSSSSLPSLPVDTGRPAGSGRRLALCIGIDRYPRVPLNGCVNDARAWADYLVNQQGFQLHRPLLLNEEATLKRMRQAMNDLVAAAAPGDILVLQYAGHGAWVRDAGNKPDESDGRDEVLVPVDGDVAGYLLDDEIAQISSRLPSGAKLIMFMDCCHSGTNYRLAMEPENIEPGERVRLCSTTPEGVQATNSRRSALRNDVSRNSDGVLHFGACQDDEYAYELNGHGDFTRHALASLHAGMASRPPAQFLADVRQRFGSKISRQQPKTNPGRWHGVGVFDVPMSTAGRSTMAGASVDSSNDL